MLKETLFLQTKEDDNDPDESRRLSALMVNAAGIFDMYCCIGRCSSSTSSGASAQAWGSC